MQKNINQVTHEQKWIKVTCYLQRCHPNHWLTYPWTMSRLRWSPGIQVARCAIKRRLWVFPPVARAESWESKRPKATNKSRLQRFLRHFYACLGHDDRIPSRKIRGKWQENPHLRLLFRGLGLFCSSVVSSKKTRLNPSAESDSKHASLAKKKLQRKEWLNRLGEENNDGIL